MLKAVYSSTIGYAFLLGGSGLAFAAGLNAATGHPGLLDPWHGAGLGLVYVLIGAAWLWTVEAQRRSRIAYQRAKVELDRLDELVRCEDVRQDGGESRGFQ